LTDAAEAHRQMRFLVDLDFVNGETSWPNQVSRLLGNLGEMAAYSVNKHYYYYNI